MKHENLDEDWWLETIYRVVELDNPKAKDLYGAIWALNNVKEGTRNTNGTDWLKAPRDLTSTEYDALIDGAEKLIALLDKLER
jgi:hypothetical protein